MTTKPTLATCVELIKAAKTILEQARAIAAAQKHGYTLDQIRDALK